MVVTEVASLMEGARSCYRGGRLKLRENSYVTEVVNLMEGKWLRYRGSQFNAGRMVILQRWSF